MRKRRSLVTYFPEEILYEILSWLGVKSLLRCKSVCKIWYAVIMNKLFVEMHVMRNGHRFCKIKRRSRIRNSDGTEEETWYLSNSCEGLLLEKKLSFTSTMPSATYQISNPTTKRIIDLPRPHDAVKTMFVFLNSSTSSYNVVSVYIDRENKNEKLELLDLGGQSNDMCLNADLSWETLNISEFDHFSSEQIYFFKYCMSSNGIFYILTIRTGQSSNPKIICADLIKKTCTTLNAPQNLRFQWHEVCFQLWRGQPSLTFIEGEKLNVCMLEDYKMQKWADTIVIPLPFLKQNPVMRFVIPRIDQVNEEECLVYQKDNNSDKVYKLVSRELCTIPTLAIRLPATLVSVKGMQSRRKNPGARYISFPRQRHILVKRER